MQQVTKDSGFSDQAIVVRVNARLRHLQDKLALWHGEMTRDEEERIQARYELETCAPIKRLRAARGSMP